MLRTLLAVVVCFIYGLETCFGYNSCRELKLANPSVSNGEYDMYNGNGQTYKAFCEFHAGYGYMFVSKNTRVAINPALINPSTSEVLVRHIRSNQQQYDTVMQQLSNPQYANIPLSIQYNKFDGYNPPLNRQHWAPYIYLGFLPKSVAASRTVQGYRANNQDFTFTNCDSNPNSYLAFFFNENNADPTNYHTRCCYNNFMKQWIEKGIRATVNLPPQYFFQYEMHMGGCGGYIISGYGTLAHRSLAHVNGAALGMKFAL